MNETTVYDLDRLDFTVVCIAAVLIVLMFIKHWRR